MWSLQGLCGVLTAKETLPKQILAVFVLSLIGTLIQTSHGVCLRQIGVLWEIAHSYSGMALRGSVLVCLPFRDTKATFCSERQTEREGEATMRRTEQLRIHKQRD